MSLPRLTIYFLAVLVLGSFFSGCGCSSSMTMNPAQLAEEYFEDADAAQKKYGGKVVRFVDVRPDGALPGPSILFTAPNKRGAVICKLDTNKYSQEEMEKIIQKTLMKAKLTVTGTVKGWAMGMVVVENATVEQ